MPLKPSSERERVRSLVLIEARFTQLFHTNNKVHTQSTHTKSVPLSASNDKKERRKRNVIMVLRRAASIAVASTSKRCASCSSSSSFGVRRHNSHSSSPLGNQTQPNTKNNVNIEEMPELTAFDAIGGLLKASTGGIAVFGVGAVGVIGVASFAANVSKQFIRDGGEKKEKTKGKREILLEELNALKEGEDTWGNRRRQREVKGELKKLVDEM